MRNSDAPQISAPLETLPTAPRTAEIVGGKGIIYFAKRRIPGYTHLITEDHRMGLYKVSSDSGYDFQVASAAVYFCSECRKPIRANDSMIGYRNRTTEGMSLRTSPKTPFGSALTEAKYDAVDAWVISHVQNVTSYSAQAEHGVTDQNLKDNIMRVAQRMPDNISKAKWYLSLTYPPAIAGE